MRRPKKPNRKRRRLHRRHTPAIIEMYRSGLSLDEVAAHFGTTGPTIWRRLNAAGVETRGPGMALSIDLDPADVVAVYEAGCTLDEAAALLDVSSGTVRRRLLAAGVSIRGSGSRYPFDADALVARVAEALGRSPDAVRPHIRMPKPPEPDPSAPSAPAELLVDVDWCRQMRSEGHAVAEIADWLGVSATALDACLAAAPE